ncbi:MAG: hypothetical protein Fur0022_33510 [Anaerolineales bacterium]
MSYSRVKDKNTHKKYILLTSLILIGAIVLSACVNNILTNISANGVKTENLSPTLPIQTSGVTVTSIPSTPLPSQATTVIAPEILGSFNYLQYSYSLVHDYDYDNCTTEPYVCPDIYNAWLSDVYNWLYVRPGETFTLAFQLSNEYKIRLTEAEQPCQTMQDSVDTSLISITCQNSGEYVLKLDLEDIQHNVSFPLYLNLVSISEHVTITAVIPPELSIEEYELRQHPETDTRFFEPVSVGASEVLAKHEGERGALLEGMKASHLENGAIIQAELTYEPGITHIEITQDGKEIFTAKAPVMANDTFLGLWTLADHWWIEFMKLAETSFRAFTWGEIVQDGQSLNEINGYTESFGFQLMHGKPFYFFERDGQVGIVYDGQEIPLGYKRVLHHGCCSAASLNPMQYENMVGFFAVREDKWYYVEIGVFK